MITTTSSKLSYLLRCLGGSPPYRFNNFVFAELNLHVNSSLLACTVTFLKIHLCSVSCSIERIQFIWTRFLGTLCNSIFWEAVKSLICYVRKYKFQWETDVLFMAIPQNISRTTRPNRSLFLLILMHFPCWIWTWDSTILTYLKIFDDKIFYVYFSYSTPWCRSVTVKSIYWMIE